MIFHQPVLLGKVIQQLRVTPGKIYLDATIGGGGHTQAIIEAGGVVLGIDQDPEALKYTEKKLGACPVSLCQKQRETISQNKFFQNNPWRLIENNFNQLDKIIKKFGITELAGIVFDLGASYHQLIEPGRGFSFHSRETLDMRMSPQMSVTAADLVAALSEHELYQIFTKFSQEEHARAIADAIVRARKVKPIKTGWQLGAVVEKLYRQRRWRRKKIHPATKIFQALRITVNDELNNLTKALPKAIKALATEGRIVIISFHEGEDRFVKNFFKKSAQQKIIKILTKSPIRADQEEINRNPSSRSAKLRSAQKI